MHLPKNNRNRHETGNVLFIIMIAIALVALLTQLVSKSSDTQSDILSTQTRDDEISRMQTQAAALGAAIQQMIVNGENPATLYSNLSTLKPGDAGFETSPHNFKIYHPLGGGVDYMSGSTSASSAVATEFGINKSSIITGVGATDAAVGDILFTAKISTAAYCGRINEINTGSATVPVMATATFNALFTAGTTVTLAAGNCASCVRAARLCVSNTGATAWGYYAALLPG